MQNKYNTSIEGDIEYYYSSDRDFDPDEDQYLGDDSVYLKGKKTEEENLKKVDISALSSGNHYFFAIINYSGGENISSEHSRDHEYVKITILPLIDPPLPPEEPEENGSFPVYEVEEEGYFTKQTINPIDPDNSVIIGYGFANQQPGTVPVFEFNTGIQYFYTATAWEFDYVYTDKGWEYLSVAYYTYPTESPEGDPVWRLWHYDSGTHDWIVDPNQKNLWETLGSHRVDGIAWRILDPQY